MDNQIYGLTKGQLSPTSPRGTKSVSSAWGSFEEPVNPLLYVLAYGAGFVAQGTPADMPSLASVIEQAIRYPGFAFVNVQSPCVTFGEPEAQLRAHKTSMRKLESLGHDASDRARAMALAQDYGKQLYTGVLFRDPAPRPTFEALAHERRRELGVDRARRARALDGFRIDADAIRA
jgi:2-oxoglutarate ferredoxin oxidoreductase subunit beta